MRGRRHIPAVVDAAAVLGLVLVGMTVLDGVFDGWGFLAIAAVGALAGLTAAALVLRLHWTWVSVLAPLTLAILLLGPPLTLGATAAGPIPGGSATGLLGQTLVGGWMDLLTTLPPVDSTGRLSLLPFLLALVGGAAGLLLARRTQSPHLPAVAPILTAACAVLLGLGQASAIVPRALLLVAGVLGWGLLRRRRNQLTGSRGGQRIGPSVGGLLAGSAALVVGIVALLPDIADSPRLVLREHVRTAVEMSDQASPLATFRRFRPATDDLADQTLITVTGLPSGTRVRLATLDHYAGTVWAAGAVLDGADPTAGRFLRIGSRIPVHQPGPVTEATVTVGDAYAEVPELRWWVPDVGRPTRFDFVGPDAAELSESLRYNTATGAALLLGGLRPGDSYTVEAILTDQQRPDQQSPVPAVGAPAVDPQITEIMSGYLSSVIPAGARPAAALSAVAEQLRTTGSYTDGAGAEAVFRPGHSLGRLSSFFADTPAGNDEQYAAALALCAEVLGLPSRVVLGAIPDDQGVIRGADVRAWVEVQLGPEQWWSIPPEDFVPDRSRHPTVSQIVRQERTEAAVVPPPSALRPPSSLDRLELDTSDSGRLRDPVDAQRVVIPTWLIRTLQITAVPFAVVLLWTVLVIGAKAVRRAGRRRTGSPSRRVTAAWDEIVDSLRDAGRPVSHRHTRSEVAALAPGLGITRFGVQVDLLGFGPQAADEQDAANVWAQVRRVRGRLAAGQSWRRRWRAAVSLVSARPDHVSHVSAETGTAAPRLVRPSTLQRRRVLGEPSVPPVAGSGGPVTSSGLFGSAGPVDQPGSAARGPGAATDPGPHVLE